MTKRKTGWAGLSLFRGADEPALAAVIGDCELLALPAGTHLLTAGERNDSVYLLLSGQLAVHLDTAAAPEAAMPIEPGECVGELSAIDGKPVSALVLAATDTRVLKLPPDLFWDRLMAIPGVARNLLVALAARMRRGNEIMLEAQRRQIALEHLQRELEVARELQAGMLPLRRPMFPGRSDIEIAAVMEPTAEVGGDLFDAFFVDGGRLFFYIGDVSGHGIPAALFMARIVGLMRVAAMADARPERLLERVNDELCTGNDAGMLVTLFCGLLDVAAGHLVYSHAGHCAPLLLSRGRASPLPMPKGSLAGAMPGLRYQAREIALDEGDALLCFTDGVTEAQTAAGEEFSEERLMETAARNSGRPLEALLDAVRADVAEFTGHRPLADDCTLLTLRRPRRAG